LTRRLLVTVLAGGLIAGGSLAAGAATTAVEATSQEAVAAVPSAPAAGGMRNLMLAQDMFGRGKSAVLAIDTAGTLWAYPADKNAKLGKRKAVGTGFQGIKVYPLVGDRFGLEAGYKYFVTSMLLGVNCQGEMHSYSVKTFGGSASPIRRVGTGWSSFQVAAVGSLNGDGRHDVVAVNQAGLLMRYPFKGSGFSKPVQIGHGWMKIRIVPSADLTGDEKADLLAIMPDGVMYLYASKGGGRFAPKQKIGPGWSNLDVASGADLNGDGRNDLVARKANGQLLYYQGLGKGRFAKPVQIGSGWGKPFTEPDCSANPPKQGTMMPVP